MANKTLLTISLSTFLLSFSAHAETAMNQGDNSGINVRDRHENEQTADDANNNASDLEIMQKIRKAVVADDSLSTYGHNVKIVSENGKVTLKGPVNNVAERQNIVKKATQVAGPYNVTDQLSISN